MQKRRVNETKREAGKKRFCFLFFKIIPQLPIGQNVVLQNRVKLKREKPKGQAM
jgi:hypothetical protein